jgi:hypothetical protein
MSEFTKMDDIPGCHEIMSDNVLHCAETGRVVAVFYNDYDLDDVISKISKPEPKDSYLDVIRDAIEERDDAIRAVEDLAESMIYRGNSVGWWQSKADNYKSALREAWAELKAAGVKSDGQTTVAEAIKKLSDI